MDTYGVVHGDIAAELPGLYSGGFSGATKPTDTQVTAFITTADTIVGLRVSQNTGLAGASTDKAAVLARQYVVEWVKAKVLEIAYTGNDPASVDLAVRPYRQLATDLLAAIDALGAQAAGEGDPDPRIRVPDVTTATARCLVVDDCDLDASRFRDVRTRRF